MTAADLAHTLDTAHAAVERGDWRTAYDVLAAVRAEGTPLPLEAVDELGRAAWWLGRTQESIRLSEEVHHQLLADGLLDRAAQSAAEVAIVAMLRGDGALGSGWLSRARRLLQDRPPGLAHGLVAFADCLVAIETSDLDAVRARALEMQALGRQIGELTISSLGLMLEGVARARDGELVDGFALLDEAMLPVIGGQVIPEFAGAMYCLTISTCTELADLERARRWTVATERWCEQFSDAVMYLGICRVHRAHLLEREGAWDRAEQEAQRVCEELADVNASVVAEGFYQVGEVRRLRGELDAAEQSYRRARALGRIPQPGEALLRLARGQHEEAWQVIEQAFGECRDDPFTRARLLLAEAEIGHATRRATDVARSASSLDAIAERYGSEGLCTWAAHARGLSLLTAGDAGQAVEALTDARRRYDAMHARYDAARLRLLQAECERMLGHDDRASAEERAGRAALDALGAAPTSPPPGGLTPRELEVLAHVAAGASNRRIGEALSITEKTVGRHLSNIYLKLDVGSRTEAAAWAHQHQVAAVR